MDDHSREKNKCGLLGSGMWSNPSNRCPDLCRSLPGSSGHCRKNRHLLQSLVSSRNALLFMQTSWLWRGGLSSLSSLKFRDVKPRLQRARDGCQVVNDLNWNPAAYLWLGIKCGGSQSGRGLAEHASPTYRTLHATLPPQWVQCGYYLTLREGPSLITSTAVAVLLHIRHVSACLSLPCKSKGPVSRGQDMELHKSYLTVISSFQPYKERHSAMIGREVTIKVTGAGDWSALRLQRQRVNSASLPE